ncbi:MAG TPA: hypothetical protein VGE52_07315, partial [Pirellulales bacterium]
MSIRLTLRVLLAYVDWVLEPAEMAEVEPRIKESEAAQHLIERLKHSMVRADLTAPSPVDDDKYDANRIADYLDRVTPDSQIEELEKMFLASDALLAELASCHHILKLVLSGPPTFDPAIRERMRTLPAKADALLAERSKETNGEGKSKLKPAIGLPKSTAEIEQIAKSVLGEPPSGSIIAAAAASKGAAVVEPAEKPEIPD